MSPNRTPVGMTETHLQQRVLNLLPRLIGMRVWTPRTVSKPLRPLSLVPPQPFVAGLPAHAVPVAQLHKWTLVPEVVCDESLLLVHRTLQLRSEERRVGGKDLLYLAKSVTYVPRQLCNPCPPTVPQLG